MRLLVYEHITGGGLAGESLPASLCAEGELMVRSLLEDLSEIGELDLVVPRDARLICEPLPGRVLRVAAGDLRARWRSWITQVDAVWPIAPESDGLLEWLSADVCAAGRALVGSTPEAVRVASSKRATCDALRMASVRVVDTVPVLQFDRAAGPGPWVVKPDDGVGCEGIRVFDTTPELCAWLDQGEPDAYVVQPLVPGEPGSVSLLGCAGEARVLSCNRQRVRRSGSGFALDGVEVNAYRDDGSWRALAEGVARALPGLRGYVGIDVLQTSDGPLVLEVNPRLTTSYAGLRAALATNPAPWVLAAALDQRLPTHAPGGGTSIEVRIPNAA